MMPAEKDPYVKPAVIQLEYRVDMTVRLSNCKTNQGTNSGSNLCGSALADPCSSIGS